VNIRDLFVPFEDELQLLPSKRVPAPPLIEWKSAFGDFFFREKGADPQILWCVLGRGAPPKRPLSKQRLDTLKGYVSPAYASRTFFRVVPFADGDDWALVRPKRALVKSPAQPMGAIWQWRATLGDGQKEMVWLNQPLAWFEEWLREQSSRELDLAREIAPLGADARMWALFTGPRDKWEVLVPALQKLVFDVSEMSSEKAASTWRLSPHGRFVTLRPDWTPTESPLPEASLKLITILVGQLPLQFYRSRWRSIGIRGKEQTLVIPSFSIQAPSFHERLEAALLWRDFAREIGKEDEIEPLLRELMG